MLDQQESSLDKSVLTVGHTVDSMKTPGDKWFVKTLSLEPVKWTLSPRVTS